MKDLSLIIGAIAFLATALGIAALILAGSARADRKRREEADFTNQPWDNADGRGNR